MTEFFEIQWKTGLIIGFGVILYVLFLSKDLSFRRNRYWLLAYLIAPWIVPILSMPVWIKNVLFKKEIKQSLVLNIDQFATALPVRNVEPDVAFDWNHMFLIVFLTITLLFIVRFFIGIIALKKMRNNSYKDDYKGFSLRILKNKDIHPFSFLRTIYVPENINQNKKCDLILEHEMTHCKQLHSIDIILADIVLFLQWWNPFVWWLKKLIAQNHEYYVDSIIYKRTSVPKEYQYLILDVLSKNIRLQFVHNFNGSFIKKRIVMMNQNKNKSKINNLKFIPVLFVGMVALLAFTNPDKTEENQHKNSFNQQNVFLDNYTDINSFNIVNTDNSVANYNVSLYSDSNEIANESKNNSNNLGDKKENFQPNRINQTEDSVQNKQLIQIHKNNILEGNTKKKQKTTNISQLKDPLVIIDGNKSSMLLLNALNPSEISRFSVIKNQDQLAPYIDKYGNEANAGVVLVSLNSKKDDSKVVHYVRGYPIQDPKTLDSYVTKKNPYILAEGSPISSTNFQTLDVNKIKKITILDDYYAKDMFGDKDKNGVVFVTFNNSDDDTDKVIDTLDISNTNLKPYSPNVKIKGKKPYFIVDGNPMTYKEFKELDEENIESISVLKDKNATDRYGDKAKNGVVIVSTKK